MMPIGAKIGAKNREPTSQKNFLPCVSQCVEVWTPTHVLCDRFCYDRSAITAVSARSDTPSAATATYPASFPCADCRQSNCNHDKSCRFSASKIEAGPKIGSQLDVH